MQGAVLCLKEPGLEPESDLNPKEKRKLRKKLEEVRPGMAQPQGQRRVHKKRVGIFHGSEPNLPSFTWVSLFRLSLRGGNPLEEPAFRVLRAHS